MKRLSLFFLLSFFIFLLCHCNRTTDLKVEISNCPKQLTLESIDFTDTGYTSLHIFHEGFCYTSTDSVILIKSFISGYQQIYLTDTLNIARKDIAFNQSSDESSTLYIKLIEHSDTAETISAKLKAVYQNHTESNETAFTYQLPCKRHIGSTVTELIDTMSCETTAGTGDRHLITFEHQGYCTQEIDSIAGNGDFYSNDGFYWNSSVFLVPRERIIFQESNTYLQKISFKLCVTNFYSDYVTTQFYAIYKDGSKSNITKFRITFEYQNDKKCLEKKLKEQIE